MTSHQSQSGPAADAKLRVLAAYTDDIAGRAVLRAAAVEASLREVPLRVVHRLVGPEAPEVFGSQEDSDANRRRVQKDILRIAQDCAPDCEVEVEVFSDSIADHLVLASRTAAVVVAGATITHATTAALVQAVPRELAHRAHCPILLVPSAATDTSTKQLLCGIDRSSGSVEALRWAVGDASLRGITVLAIEVLGAHQYRHGPGEAAADLLTSWVRENVPELPTTVLCGERHGAPGQVLIDLAAEHDALLVLGAHQRHSGHWPRSVARAAMSQTRVPVVIVPSQSD